MIDEDDIDEDLHLNKSKQVNGGFPMTEDLIFIILFLLIVTVFAIPLGKYMSKVFTGERTFMTPVMRPLEKFIYRIGSVDENQEMTWKRYAYALTYIEYNWNTVSFYLTINTKLFTTESGRYVSCQVGHGF